MTTMKFKNGIWALCLGFGMTATAQTADEISLAIEKEDYIGARKMCQQLISKDPKSADGYFFMGETYYENERADSARYFYSKGLEQNNDAALCLVGQSKLLLDQNKAAEAQKGFEKAAKMTRNKNAYVLYQIGKAYLDANYGKAYKDKDYAPTYANQAIEWLDKAVAIDNKKGDYFSLLGDAYFFKKEAGQALTKYEFATDKNKKDPKNYVKRARINRSAKIFKDAEANLNECLAIDPNYAPALKELTELYVSSGQYSKVAPVLQKYTALVGGDIESRMRLVRYLCYYAQDYKGTITEANNVLKSSPDKTQMYRWLAWAHLYNGKATEKENAAGAAEDYKMAMEYSKNFLANPGDNKLIASDYDNYMQAAIKAKDFDIAAKMSKEVLAIDSTRTDIYETIAKGYYDGKQYEKAAEAYQLKVSKTKAISTDYFYIGNSYMMLKKYPEAEGAFAKLTEISPTYLYAWQQRARIAEFGDPELKTGAAKPFHDKVLELGKVDEAKNKAGLLAANKYLGAYYVYLTTDYPKALEYYKEALRLDPTNADVQTAITTLEAQIAAPAGNK
jgi:tetratricopeptide (TPR) repeat protein